MKTWQRPAAVGQEFAANDYVSACTKQISCDVKLPNEAVCVWLTSQNTVDFDGDGIIEGSNDGFQPCGKVHDVSADTKIGYYEFHKGWDKDDHTVTFTPPVKLAYWADSEGDVHITDPANVENAVANKS